MCNDQIGEGHFHEEALVLFFPRGFFVYPKGEGLFKTSLTLWWVYTHIAAWERGPVFGSREVAGA